MRTPILVAVAFACAVAAAVWGRSARYLRKLQLRVEGELGPDEEPVVLARASFRKELHTTLLYSVLGLASLAAGLSSGDGSVLLYGFILVPIAITAVY